MTARELLQKIVDGEAGEYVRYAPVDLIKAEQLLREMENAENGTGMDDFLKAISASVGEFNDGGDDDSIR